MHQRDYLMRLIKSLNDAIIRIVGHLENDEEEKAKEVIAAAYENLGYDEDFIKSGFFDVAQNFSSSTLKFEKLDFLSQLFYLESKIITEKSLKIEKLQNSRFLAKLCIKNSNIFSLERENRLASIVHILKMLENENSG